MSIIDEILSLSTCKSPSCIINKNELYELFLEDGESYVLGYRAIGDGSVLFGVRRPTLEECDNELFKKIQKLEFI